MNLTLQYDQVLFILEPTGVARSLARKRVTVIDYPDGRLAIRHNGVDLPRFPEYAFEVDPPDPVAIQAQPERARKAESARSRPVPEGRGITRINVFLFGGDNPKQSTCAPPATARHDPQQYTPLAKTHPSFQS